MKHAIFTIALLVTTFCAACDGGKPGNLTSIAAAAADNDPTQTLIQLKRNWIRAMLSADTAQLEQMLAASFRYTDSNGNQVTGMQITDDLKSGALKFEAFELNEIHVQFYQGAAVVFGIYTYRGIDQGQAVDEHVRCTDFFVRENGQDGRWVVVASQASRLPR